jgi:site-specific recombinase XerD
MTQSTQTVSPLRQRMIDDMNLRKLNPKTQDVYIRSVIKLTHFLGRSPDAASPEDLRRFQLHLASASVSNTSINATISGPRVFFEVTLDDHQALGKMSTVREPRKLPVVLYMAKYCFAINISGSAIAPFTSRHCPREPLQIAMKPS